MEQTYVLDRMEGDSALLIGQQGGGILAVPVACLPEGCREGDLLCRTDEGWKNDPVAGALRRRRMEERLRRLLEKNK